jgi:hypothetical protein
MTPKPFTYQVHNRRGLRIALAALAKGNSNPFVKYLIDGGTIIDERDRRALADALTPAKKRGKPADTSEASRAADHILFLERSWRKAHPGKRSPRGYRQELIDRIAQAAWRDDGQHNAKLKDQRQAEWEYKNAVDRQIRNAIENKRKNRSRKPRIKK